MHLGLLLTADIQRAQGSVDAAGLGQEAPSPEVII